MEKKSRPMMSHRAWWLVPGTLGDICLIVGIITAATNTTFAGFNPMIWVLLTVALYLYGIFVIALQIRFRLEDKT